MTILPSAYLPSIEYFAHIAQRECIIDLGEHYIKRSQRNRTRIMTASGAMELSVNVKNANRPRMKMQRVEIDYSKKWQHQHLLAVLSAYKSSPFYDHYAPYLEGIFTSNYELLVDLNWAFITQITKLIGLTPNVTLSQEYVECTPEDCDLRPKRRDTSGFSHEQYIQVFYDREPYVANLSILDLLFNEGPSTLSILINSKL